MSDRELRDEVEALFGELKRERQRTEAPLDAELAAARTAFTTEIAGLTAQAQALREKVAALGTQRKTHEEETRTAKAQLEEARAEIARREPLGNPLSESRSNWETGDPGCAIGLWVMLCVAMSAMGWWLR
jgi:chromosome segregation ATPase